MGVRKECPFVYGNSQFETFAVLFRDVGCEHLHWAL